MYIHVAEFLAQLRNCVMVGGEKSKVSLVKI